MRCLMVTDLPTPEVPMMNMTSPRSTFSVTPMSTFFSPKVLWTSWNSMDMRVVRCTRAPA